MKKKTPSHAKRALGLVLTAAMLAGLVLAAMPAALANMVGAGPGDVNGDGIINAADVTMLRRYIARGNATGLTGFVEANAHTVGAQTITTADVTRLRDWLAATDPATVPLVGKPPEGRKTFAASDFPAGTRFMALTFDDGPHDNWTLQILNYLQTFNPGQPFTNRPPGNNSGQRLRDPAYVSFYINGVKLTSARRPLVQRMIREGHDVDNHSWDHPDFGGLSAVQARDQIRRTSQAIFDYTGWWPFSFRAPFFGWGSSLNGLDRENVLAFHHAVLDTNDWQVNNQNNPVGMGADVRNRASDGAVILMHDDGGETRQGTVDSLQHFMPQLQAQGYAFVTVRQLHYIKNAVPENIAGNNHGVNQRIPHGHGQWNHTPLWHSLPPDSFYSNSATPWSRALPGP
jgi:peptidoglycan/xylan/chitin deacetylase (PgdA/CDA1 family)